MSSSERTPLVTTVVVGRQKQRYPHSTLRRFCTIALACSVFIVLFLFLLPIDLLPSRGNEKDRHRVGDFLPWASPYPHKSWPQSQGLSYEELQQVLLETPNEEKAREWSQYYTAGPHLAGKNLSQALWTRERWEEWGVSSSLASYDVYINYPLGHRLALLEINSDSTPISSAGKGKQAYTVKYECELEEDVLEEDSTTGLDNRVPTFHGYSASGNVTAQYVYANFGSYKDFEDLRKANVSLEGKIALVKNERIFRGLKTKRAQELGMAGIVMYTDPQEDRNITEVYGYKAYPDGPARNPSSVQRGSTQFLSIAPGDPTTPGYPSKPGVHRGDPHLIIPKIPSLPISYRDALPLLQALNGHGPSASSFNKYWQGGGLGHKNVSYNIGPSPPNVVLDLLNEQSYTINPLWNVIGIINGSLPNEVLIIGNHRDAWIAGGAGDPNSGSAALNEVIRSFGAALKRGWRPLRTIVFASWDGEEYGLVGSTEWVEEYLPWLSSAAIAYLNVDVGARGPLFRLAASPLLNKALYEATSLVKSPNQTVPGQTVRDSWDGHISTIGAGSDYTAFQDFAGIPSVDMGFAPAHDSPVYHYHSNYDSFHWMDNFGDPGFEYHITITKVWALLAASLLESPILGFNATDYATALVGYLESLKHLAAKSENESIRFLTATSSSSPSPFSALESAIAALQRTAISFDAHAASLATQIRAGVPWWKWWQRAQLYYAVQSVNRKYKYFERQFLYPKGLDGRNWYKHVVFAPGLWMGYSGVKFAGIVEAVEAGDEEGVRRWCEIVRGKVEKAEELLG